MAAKTYMSRDRVRIEIADGSIVYRKPAELTGSAPNRKGVAFVNGGFFGISETEAGFFKVGKKAKDPRPEKVVPIAKARAAKKKAAAKKPAKKKGATKKATPKSAKASA